MLERPLQTRQVNLEERKLPHRMMLMGRKQGTIAGVEDVISFDEHLIVLETSEGLMKLTGQELHIKSVNLDTGEVEMEGLVASIQYTDIGAYTKPGESVLKRIFR